MLPAISNYCSPFYRIETAAFVLCILFTSSCPLAPSERPSPATNYCTTQIKTLPPYQGEAPPGNGLHAAADKEGGGTKVEDKKDKKAKKKGKKEKNKEDELEMVPYHHLYKFAT